MMVNRVLRNLNDQQKRILRLQDELATGLKVNRPSDDPLAARRAINSRTEIAKNEQYITNISTASPALTETETAISTVLSAVQRVNELTLQGSNGTQGQPQRDQIAIEINQILETVVENSNHVTQGRYIFGGTRTLNPSFVAARDANGDVTAVSYEGNDEKSAIEISDGVRVNTNETGRDVFTQTSAQSTDIFQTIIDIRDNLRSGNVDGLTTGLEELSKAQDQLLISSARIGAVQNRLESMSANAEDLNTQLKQVLSDSIDADYAEVVLNLNAQSNAFQASLNAGARVIQPSLLDFIQ
jgi:flagellar hook-associated protein 3 FlgL